MKQGIANPIVQYLSWYDASIAAGFSLRVPAFPPLGDVKEVFVIGGKTIDLRYPGGMCYRMAKLEDTRDISGDYTRYPDVQEFVLGDCQVTAKGYGNLIFCCIWVDKEYAYSITVPQGAPLESVKALIGSMAPVSLGGEDEADGEGGLPNPVKVYPSLFEVIYEVPFSIAVPAHWEQFLERVLVIGGKILEVDYHGGIQYRQALGKEDISGHFEDYEVIERFAADHKRVTLKGGKDGFNLALWLNDFETFSLYTSHPMSREWFTDVIRSVGVING